MNSHPVQLSLSIRETLANFLQEIDASELVLKYTKIVKLVDGPLRTAKNKVFCLNKSRSDKVKTLLPLVSHNYFDDLLTSILNLYEEEVEGIRYILADLEKTFKKLEIILLEADQKLVNGIKKEVENKTSVVDSTSLRKVDCDWKDIFTLYEDCQNILAFYKIKARLVKNYILTPSDTDFPTSPIFYELEEVIKSIKLLFFKLKSSHTHQQATTVKVD